MKLTEIQSWDLHVAKKELSRTKTIWGISNIAFSRPVQTLLDIIEELTKEEHEV
jgi:hypothetical protein